MDNELLKDPNMRCLCRELIRYTKKLMEDPAFMAEYEAWKKEQSRAKANG